MHLLQDLLGNGFLATYSQESCKKSMIWKNFTANVFHAGSQDLVKFCENNALSYKIVNGFCNNCEDLATRNVSFLNEGSQTKHDEDDMPFVLLKSLTLQKTNCLDAVSKVCG